MKLFTQAISFGSATLISRILGFVRDAVTAYFFGAGPITDAFFVAFRLPNSFRRLIGEGGFNAVFVPLYTRALEEGRERAFLSRVFGFYLASVSAITLFAILFADLIIALIAPGLLKGESFSLAVFMARFLFAYMILVGLSSLFMGILNVRGKFFIPALAQAVFNGFFVLTLLSLADSLGYLSLILGVILGGLFQVLINLPILLRQRVPLGFSLELSEDIKTMMKRLIPALGGFGVSQLSIFIDTFLASFIGRGAISYLYYAGRLYQLPFGIISASVANSLLPILSKSGTDRSRSLTDALRLLLIFIIPASAGLFMLSEEIINVIYRRGEFTHSDALITSEVLAIYSLGLPLMSLQKVLSVSFFSLGDTATPVKASVLTVLAEGAFASVFAFLLGYGLIGLPLGTVISFAFGTLYLSLQKSVTVYGGELAITFLRVALSSLMMIVFIAYVKDLELPPSAVLFISVPVGAFIYFVCLLLLKESLTLRLGKSLVQKFGNP